ncbi:hypothetical protein, partial [Acetobacter senegalensis]|uniref:hypothetical protein n=1 Tax=Acetobacter senegalensis TaxID=446692 RepID=UPI001EDC62D0
LKEPLTCHAGEHFVLSLQVPSHVSYYLFFTPVLRDNGRCRHFLGYHYLRCRRHREASPTFEQPCSSCVQNQKKSLQN